MITGSGRPAAGALVAEDKRLTGFHLHQGNKKQAKIMIDPLAVRPELAAGWTPPGNVLQFLDFGLDACDQKHLCVDRLALPHGDS